MLVHKEKQVIFYGTADYHCRTDFLTNKFCIVPDQGHFCQANKTIQLLKVEYQSGFFWENSMQRYCIRH